MRQSPKGISLPMRRTAGGTQARLWRCVGGLPDNSARLAAQCGAGPARFRSRLRIEPARRVHRYVEIALDDALSGADNVVRFFESLMERLAPEPHLIKTLEAFFEHRQHRKVVSGGLHIHPNTLSYRLERMETLLGRSSMTWVGSHVCTPPCA